MGEGVHERGLVQGKDTKNVRWKIQKFIISIEGGSRTGRDNRRGDFQFSYARDGFIE